MIPVRLSRLQNDFQKRTHVFQTVFIVHIFVIASCPPPPHPRTHAGCLTYCMPPSRTHGPRTFANPLTKNSPHLPTQVRPIPYLRLGCGCCWSTAGIALRFSTLSLFESVYLEMHSSDSSNKKRNNGSADRPRYEYRSHRSCDALGCSQIHALERPSKNHRPRICRNC